MGTQPSVHYFLQKYFFGIEVKPDIKVFGILLFDLLLFL